MARNILYVFPVEDAVTVLASFDDPPFPVAPSGDTPSSLEATGANPPAAPPPPRWTYTWFELAELAALPAPEALDAFAPLDVSAVVTGDSPCCDEPDTDEFPAAEAAAMPAAWGGTRMELRLDAMDSSVCVQLNNGGSSLPLGRRVFCSRNSSKKP